MERNRIIFPAQKIELVFLLNSVGMPKVLELKSTNFQHFFGRIIFTLKVSGKRDLLSIGKTIVLMAGRSFWNPFELVRKMEAEIHERNRFFD